MLMPSIFGENLMDNFFAFPFGDYHKEYKHGYIQTDLMKTDIKDNDQNYEITMNMPGVKKEDITAELKDGYLIVRVTSNSSKDEKDEKGRYIRRERYSGSCSRSFYIGDTLTQEEIKARFENGTLILEVPKKKEKLAEEDKKFISIEG